MWFIKSKDISRINFSHCKNIKLLQIIKINYEIIATFDIKTEINSQNAENNQQSALRQLPSPR